MGRWDRTGNNKDVDRTFKLIFAEEISINSAYSQQFWTLHGCLVILL